MIFLLLFAAELHHVHLNSTDPDAARAYYAARFEPGPLRFHKVGAPPPASLVSAVWHIGWGAPDVQGEYRRQLALGSRYTTEPTNIPEVGPKFYYSYVEGPDKVMIELNTAADAKFRHIHLLAEDPIASAEWYIRHLGVKTLGGRPLSRQNVRLVDTDIGVTANLTVSGVYLGIFPVSWARQAYEDDWRGVAALVSTADRAVDHIAFAVEGLDATLARMKAEGVRVLPLPLRDGDGGRQSYIEGPDKIVIELVEARGN
jgi:catechol 2,3-dioxygenase-like lactoylglutathione lyase family enzyme